MNKKPWYIWFSIFAFIVLWADMARRVKLSPKNSGLWSRASLNTIKYFLVYAIAPMVVTLYLLYFTVGRNLSEDSAALELVYAVVLVVLYLGGICAAYKLSVWRKTNLAHLLPGYEPPSEDKPQDDDTIS